jgi:hypothetical protein
METSLKSIQMAGLALLTLGIVGCNSVDGSKKTGTLEVLLHDAPANFEKVIVYIDRVEVNNSLSDAGWVVINRPQKTYDLLELVNGATEVLGTAELEVGNYEQIRLILSSDGHSVVLDGVSHNLFIPSGEQTGIKLQVDMDIEADVTYTLLLDFDVSRSIVQRGNPRSGVEYLLRPVIKATNQALSGNIAGSISPVDSRAFIYAIVDSDTLSSTKADTTDGSFRIIGLEAGTYTIAIDPTNTAYQKADTTGIPVMVGSTTDLGRISLN